MNRNCFFKSTNLHDQKHVSSIRPLKSFFLRIKQNNVFAIIAVLFITLFVGCQKDKYVETIGVCLKVISTSPTNGATSVSLDKVITVTFNEKMNPATITPGVVTLQGSQKSSNGIIAGTMTYDDANATIRFVPNSPLTANTTYTGSVKSTVKDMMGNALQVDYVWTFSTGLTLAPVVVATNPVNDATGVVLNKTITATFNMAMDSMTMNDSSFIMKQGTTFISGVVSYKDSVAYFNPTDTLLPNTIYTCTVRNTKNLDGTVLQNSYTWSFTTSLTVAPSILNVDPLDKEINVPLNKVISATFSEPMDPLTLTTVSFTVKEGANNVVGTVSYIGKTVYFTPSSNLLTDKIYTAKITVDARNLVGVRLANDYTWTFSTGSLVSPTVKSTNPMDNATNVALNRTIVVKFSEPMDVLTITTTTFVLKEGLNTVAGSVSYSDSTAIFTPTANLLSGSIYTAIITKDSKNVANTPLANDYVWSFSTAAPLGPMSPNLSSVARFGIIAGVGISNNAGFSEIRNLDVGISPGLRSSVTGFPPAIMVNGAIYCADDIAPVGIAAMLTQAKLDLTAAYLYAEGATSPAPAVVSGDIGGTTLAPGIYKTTSTLLIQSGDLTLDAQGDANAVWIFQIASGFTTVGGAGGNVVLSGGAQAKNVYWQTGSSATIGDGTSFKGNIMALQSITMNTGAVAEGRMLSRNGAVVMTSTNIISKP